MKISSVNTFIALFLLIFCFHPAYARADISGKVITYACYSCHGEKLGNLNLKQPLSAQRLSDTLLKFKTNKIESTIMGRITKGYSNKELHSVAVYISELK